MLRYPILVALLAATPCAHAGELVPYHAESIALGSIRGVTYFTRLTDGFRVVTTLADGETGLPVRFETTLADRQSLTISVPGTSGGPGQVVLISRTGDKLILSRPPAPGGDSKPQLSSTSGN
jgi:hypothetical protein